MTTKKERRAKVAAKAAVYLAEYRRTGLAAQKADREYREKTRKQAEESRKRRLQEQQTDKERQSEKDSNA